MLAFHGNREHTGADVRGIMSSRRAYPIGPESLFRRPSLIRRTAQDTRQNRGIHRNSPIVNFPLPLVPSASAGSASPSRWATVSRADAQAKLASANSNEPDVLTSVGLARRTGRVARRLPPRRSLTLTHWITTFLL